MVLVLTLVFEREKAETLARASNRNIPQPYNHGIDLEKVLDTEGITASDLARRLGVSPQMVSQVLLRPHPSIIHEIVAMGDVLTKPVKAKRLQKLIGHPGQQQIRLFELQHTSDCHLQLMSSHSGAV